MVVLLAPATGRGIQLEGPQEIGGPLEIGANGEHFMDEILDALDVLRSQFTLNGEVVGDWDALTLMLDESAFVDQMTHRLQVGISPGNVGLYNAEHVNGGLVQLNEHSIVDLTEAEQLQNLTDLRGDLVDTASKNNNKPMRNNPHT